ASTHLLSSRNALSTMLADIPASIRSRIGQLSLTLDILTLLLDIICPKLRPVNPQLFSSREKDQMRELIDNMLAYNLSYRQDRTPEGQYTYVLEPFVSCVCRRVEDVARFSGLPPRRQLTYQAKQTISREMEQEKMRRAEQMMLQRNPVAPEVDFFGRAVAPKPQGPQSSSHSGEKCAVLAMGTAVGNSDVWFRFNEGMSNAVRRNGLARISSGFRNGSSQTQPSIHFTSLQRQTITTMSKKPPCRDAARLTFRPAGPDRWMEDADRASTATLSAQSGFSPATAKEEGAKAACECLSVGTPSLAATGCWMRRAESERAAAWFDCQTRLRTPVCKSRQRCGRRGWKIRA
ncbi:hypothetical protein GOODEAATRI_003037, partial [Goodea atripinnis]